MKDIYGNTIKNEDAFLKNVEITNTLKVQGDVLLPFTYSTNENWTGRYWIDQKKIYSKIVIIENVVRDVETVFTHNIPNIDNIWVTDKSFIFQKLSPEQNFPANFINASGLDQQISKTRATRTCIRYLAGAWLLTANPATLTVVLEYTCTNR